jgi:O-antigen/teichoic acid export membrane protein
MPATEKSLLQHFAYGVRDNALGEVAIQLIRVAGIMYLARHLLPADFGLYRMLLIVSSFAILTGEAGLPDALIQRKDLSADHEATAWWINSVIGILIVGLLYFTAPLIAGWLVMPRLGPQLRLLLLPIFLVILSTAGNAKLRRNFRFGVIALADTLAELAFLISAILLQAFFQQPRWSLAGGLAVRSCVQAIYIGLASRFVPRHLPRRAAAADLAPFALSVWTGGAVVTLSSNADYILVGRILGSTTLGFYTIAWDLLRFIPDRLYKVVARVTLPLFAKMQDDDGELRERYSQFVRETSRLLLPGMAGLVIAAPEVLDVLYGRKWIAAAQPLRVLATGLIFAGITIGIGSIFYAKARPTLDIYLHGVRFILIVVTLWLIAPFGLVAACIAMSAIEGTIAISGQLMVNSLIGLEPMRLLKALGPGLRNAIFVAILTEVGRLVAFTLALHGFLALATIGALPALVMAYLELPRALALYRK